MAEPKAVTPQMMPVALAGRMIDAANQRALTLAKENAKLKARIAEIEGKLPPGKAKEKHK